LPLAHTLFSLCRASGVSERERVCYGFGFAVYDELLPSVDQAALPKKTGARLAAERPILLT
jgi:hypothetical protein